MSKFSVTLPALRKAGACVDGYNRLVRTLQGLEFTCDDAKRRNWLKFVHEDPVSIRTILDSSGIDDALWALRCIDNADNDKDVRLFAIWCARQVDHLMTDARSKTALDVAERHAHGLATDDALDAAWAAAWAAADAAADAARDAQKNRLIEMLDAFEVIE